MKIFLYFIILLKTKYTSGLFDIDDILRADLMPSSLFMLDGSDARNYSSDSLNKNSKYLKNTSENLSSNGSWYDAYATMGFHRKMLNEYLCRNFVADEILFQMQQPLMTHKLGKPFKSPVEEEKIFSPTNRKSRAELGDVKENLLADPGSSSYRDWLSKTTTLEDIYRHYDKTVANARDGEEVGVEYDGGEITGYAMPGPTNGGEIHPFPHPYGGFVHPDLIPQEEDSEKHGGGYDYSPHHVHIHGGDDEKGSHHGLALNDVFDIALTALAFLSFGMFILQVIMCITASKTTPMMPIVDATGGDTETFDDVRFKRDISSNALAINELTRRVLVSIETGMAAEKDNGDCLRRQLCENNKYSRTLKDGQKIWIPVWGLGMSWLSSRLISISPTATTMLDSLRACALGLANVDCASHYSGCDMRHLLGNRRSGRSRRSASSGKSVGDGG